MDQLGLHVWDEIVFIGISIMNFTAGDIFRAMGRYWALEDEFRYLLDPNLRYSPRVVNRMREE